MTCTDPCNCDQSLALLAEIEELRRWQTEAIASLTAVGWSTTDPGSLGRCFEILNKTYRSAQNDGLLAAERSLRHQIERERLTACQERDEQRASAVAAYEASHRYEAERDAAHKRALAAGPAALRGMGSVFLAEHVEAAQEAAMKGGG